MENGNAAWGRIMQIIKENNIRSANQFAAIVGLKRSENLYQIKKGNHGISKSLAAAINEQYPQYPIGWLVSGENYASHIDAAEVPYYEDSKSLVEQGNVKKQLMLSHELINEAECATLYMEEAMIPKIPSGAYVFLKKTSVFVYGKIYLIQLKDYTFFRIIRRAEDEEKVRLCSARPEEFEDLLINRDEILTLFEVRSVLTRMY